LKKTSFWSIISCIQVNICQCFRRGGRGVGGAKEEEEKKKKKTEPMNIN